MFHYLHKNSASIILGFLFGAMLFALFSGNSSQNFSANLSIPYEKEEAGLVAEIPNEELITQKYRLDENGEIVKDAVTGKPVEIDTGAILIGGVLTKVFLVMKTLLGAIVVFWIVFSGIYIVAGSTDEEQVKTGKQMLKYSIFGLAFMLLIEPMVLDVFYGGGDIHTDNTGIGDIEKSTQNFRDQVIGVMDFIKTLLIFIGMGYIIKAGSQMIFSHGDEEQVTSAKSIFIPLFVGFLIIMFNEVFIDQVLYKVIFTGDGTDILDHGKVTFASADGSGASQLTKEIVGFLKYLLEVIGAVLLGFIIYGGFVVMTSMGEDEKLETGKKILLNAVIGMVIVVSSFVLMMSLVNFEL